MWMAVANNIKPIIANTDNVKEYTKLLEEAS